MRNRVAADTAKSIDRHGRCIDKITNALNPQCRGVHRRSASTSEDGRNKNRVQGIYLGPMQGLETVSCGGQHEIRKLGGEGRRPGKIAFRQMNAPCADFEGQVGVIADQQGQVALIGDPA